MKYYLHDVNSFNDEKITMLFIKHGYEGIGLFYTILEKLAQQEKPVLTDVLKHQLKVGKKLNKIWQYLEEIDLISSNNGETFNKQLLNFSEKYQVKKEKNRKRITEWREKQRDSENVTHYEQVCNAPKVKESKVKESKVNIVDQEKVEYDYSTEREILNSVKDLFDVKYYDTQQKRTKWLNVIRQLINIDKENKDTIINVIKFGRSDSFWKSNLLSINSLRIKKPKSDIMKYDMIKAKYEEQKNTTAKGEPRIQQYYEPWK